MRSLTRFLVFLFLLASIGAAGLWIIGGKKNEYSISLVIDAHPSQVFPYLTQPDRLKQWTHGLEQVEEMMPLEEGSSRTVKTSRVVVDEAGTSTEFEDQVLRFTENEAFTVQSTSPSQIVTSIFQLDLKDGRKTVFDYRVKTANIGIGRLLGPLETVDIKTQMENDARRLQELVETTEPKWTPSVSDEPILQVPSFGPENLSDIDPDDPIDPSQPHAVEPITIPAEPSKQP